MTIEARPRPASVTGPGGPLVQWCRDNLFNSIPNSIISIGLIAAIIWFVNTMINWAIVDAVFAYDADNEEATLAACKAAAGACWATVAKFQKLIFFGLYPSEEVWRPGVGLVIMFAMLAAVMNRNWWSGKILLLQPIGLVIVLVLMWGGVFGMPYVETSKWGGFPLTLLLANIGIAFAFPLAILAALGRRATNMPGIKSVCVVYIEFIRGVPLISLLFMASFMLPLFLPEGFTIDNVLRAQVAIILFVGAYMAEVIRGGLQAMPKGQYEAADALGLSYWQSQRLIILPQAIRMVIPPLTNTYIAMFKDTSLVFIVGLFDFLKSATVAATGDPAWRAHFVSVYVFVAIIYFLYCFGIAKYSERTEKWLRRGESH